MRKTIIAIAVSFTLLAPHRSYASELPTWRLDDVCSEESDRGACQEFEAIARYQVSGPWETMPDNVRKTCLSEVAAFGRPSYRMLRLCLEAELFKMHQSARKARVPNPE